MNVPRYTSVLIALFVGTTQASAASGVLAASALDAVQTAVETCAHDGYRVSAVVLDDAGLVVAVLRGDGATPHTLDSAKGKAYSAVTLGPISGLQKTSAIAARILAAPETAQLAHVPGILLMSGGVALPGFGAAVGVGGAPGGAFDEACAAAGAARLKARP